MIPIFYYSSGSSTYPPVFKESHSLIQHLKTEEELEKQISLSPQCILILKTELAHYQSQLRSPLKGISHPLLIISENPIEKESFYSYPEVDQYFNVQEFESLFPHWLQKKETSLKNEMALKGELQLIMHDLKTPLTVAYTILEILKFKGIQIEEKTFQDKLISCRIHLDRIKYILSNFIYTHIEAPLPLKPISIDLNHHLKTLLEEYKPRFSSEKRSLEFSPQGPLQMTFDKQLLNQMLCNIFEHYLLFSLSNSKAPITIIENKGQINITVKFKGPQYLPPKTIETIMSNSTNRVIDLHSGLKYNKGFGLTFNQKVARIHRGSFEIIWDDEKASQILQLSLPKEIKKV